MKKKLRKLTAMNTPIAFLALTVGFADEIAPSAATAKSRAAQARAQATEDVMGGGTGVSAVRVRALRDCNARIARFRGYNALGMPTALYKTCMNEHGQME